MRLFAVLALAVLPMSAIALETQRGNVTVTPVATGLDAPWGVAELPDGSLLVTQREGQLVRVVDGQARVVRGTPRVAARGQGGLLDVTLARDFATTRTLFLTYSKPQGGGSGTALAAAELSSDGRRLENLRDLFESARGGSGGRHFGSRVVEAPDGTLYVTIGDRGDRPSAQNPASHNGSIVRVNRDGTVPADNPFVDQNGVQPHIWSYGHRNPQGAGLDGRGTLWTAEHGAQGGDEVNRVKKGANFGWPIISYGVHYSGATIGEGKSKRGMEQPAFYWDPSIAPSGLMVYQGNMFPEWRGDMFVGSLKFHYISRLNVRGGNAREVEQIKGNETLRVRDIVEAPDGSILFISVGNGTVYRMTR
ncbi:PQQ-dependent sugar dehydrogenase [uncultured Tateyamaria sp.]|uniref:PQQ-dependent sugar dehydrogenase n=1 Tax=uncultured Tateyamaria sp. TaxID=455651 RepID=UPI002628891E|nr:PQQ-dependent sugar dehydrogenase [uncultured Tateyamaria sp.]